MPPDTEARQGEQGMAKYQYWLIANDAELDKNGYPVRKDHGEHFFDYGIAKAVQEQYEPNTTMIIRKEL
jgi:hypothetical protein